MYAGAWVMISVVFLTEDNGKRRLKPTILGHARQVPLLGHGVYVFSTLLIGAKLLLKVTISYLQCSFLFYHILSLDFCDRGF